MEKLEDIRKEIIELDQKLYVLRQKENALVKHSEAPDLIGKYLKRKTKNGIYYLKVNKVDFDSIYHGFIAYGFEVSKTPHAKSITTYGTWVLTGLTYEVIDKTTFDCLLNETITELKCQ